MTQENKQLLLVDLSARLPYGVKVQFRYIDTSPAVLKRIDEDFIECDIALCDLEDVKPYLYPLSSMTEEQLYNNPIGFSQMLTIKADRDWENITINRRSYYKLVDWFNKSHFDYRGLIEKGLAIDCTNLNIY